MKTLLLVILIMTGGRVDYSYIQYPTQAACEANIDGAAEWGRSQPGVTKIIAMCTTKLQKVEGIITSNEGQRFHVQFKD